MDRKRTIRIIITIIMILFALALVEIGIRALVGTAQNISEKIEKGKQEKIEYNSEPKQQERQASTFIDNIIKAIKDNDIQYVFDSLDDNYRELMFHNKIEELKSYCENLPKDYDEYETDSIEAYRGVHIVTVTFRRSKYNNLKIHY